MATLLIHDSFTSSHNLIISQHTLQCAIRFLNPTLNSKELANL